MNSHYVGTIDSMEKLLQRKNHELKDFEILVCLTTSTTENVPIRLRTC